MDHLSEYIMGEFLGFPLAMTPSGSDDCLRHDWHIRIDGRWHEIVTEGLRFSRKEALTTLSYIFSRLAREAQA